MTNHTSYSRLNSTTQTFPPSHQSEQEEELDATFDDSDHISNYDSSERDHLFISIEDSLTPSSRGEGTSHHPINPGSLPGSYDFERDPFQPNHPPTSSTDDTLPKPRLMGQGNDGVFANLSAKPTTTHTDPTSLNGSGGSDKDEALPTYDAAALDSSPPYWETTVTLPGGMGSYGILGPDDVLVDGLAVGNLFGFAWNLLVSMSFQFIGFLLTYLLHTTHAAKNGSRAGLGITLIQYGLYSRTRSNENPSNSFTAEELSKTNGTLNGLDANWGFGGPDWDGSTSSLHQQATVEGQVHISSMANEWLSYVLIAIGWFLLLGGLVNYWRAVRWARAVRTDDVIAGAMA
ncbi:uncharacterized protein MELLADRAFT_75467 [Melampsora larici-populina 98AG31]|uniref:Metal homeostatis protein bsd2 n=1 Tax=Melampsora larici-populina (strain 98AG31 / pathotype 3-4-7) TaxID=747676 RepID=F4RYV6_MELLP|nr:uncharacterized protein MELLADRAFT_75467 [Melampsora larici-populina 98AG31]EGG02437.1 hypothetical protein MELLADRAFT_75467 [Melampsora larici-populina 98AG31]